MNNLKVFLVRIFDKSIRPTWFYRFMVALSFLYGLGLLIISIIAIFSKQFFISYVSSSSLPTTFYFYKENILFFLSSGKVMYIIGLFVGIGILYGCYLLIRGYKWGLLFYTIAKVFQVFVPIAFLGTRMFAIGDVMIIVLFLFYYYVYAFSHNIPTEQRKYHKLKLKFISLKSKSVKTNNFDKQQDDN